MQLTELVTQHFRLQQQQQKALKKLGIATIHDLLYHFPVRYETSGEQQDTRAAHTGDTVRVCGVLRGMDTRKTWGAGRMPVSEGVLEDGAGTLNLIWFRQPYIARMFPSGAHVCVSGKVTERKGVRSIANPDIRRATPEDLQHNAKESLFQDQEASNTHPADTLFAYYPESQGITSRWFRHALARIFSRLNEEVYADPIPEHIRTTYHLPSLKASFFFIHTPKTEKDAAAARKRFAFEEIFTLQCMKQQERLSASAAPTYTITDGATHLVAFQKLLPFAFTEAQKCATEHVMEDMQTPPAMSRLLEGDVGSGKTAVAAAASFATVHTSPSGAPSARLQVCYMAPTEILAEQHFASFCELLAGTGIRIGLITGSKAMVFPSKTDRTKPTKVSKPQLKKWVADGSIPILIGTHALTYASVAFRYLGLVIVDEQHRFGTKQRQSLTRKDTHLPHLLSMTATPIPRTLALTIYGDLDITLLEGMPPGRKPVKTSLVTAASRPNVYAHIRAELQSGRQAYVICPRIDEADPDNEMAPQTRSVLQEAATLSRGELKGFRIATLHGKMKPKEKEAIMRAFAAHEYDVLVATSVVEVGVNVPNATNILIEGAERFGLAQLHQLRGRVVRSTHQAHCFAATTSGKVSARLTAFKNAKNGFALAEKDLALRGSGELLGRSQSGVSDVGMEALRNLKLVEAARTEAQKLVAEDALLTKHPRLQEKIERVREAMHWE
jgi:ATP-dependent DNA helicase RecG